MYEELKYLRDEVNQRHSFFAERVGKTINTILLVWGGALSFLIYTKPTMERSMENIPLYFLIATVFFVSNLVISFLARRYNRYIDSTLRLVSYLAVFYEKRPSKEFKVGEDFCWELAFHP